MRVWQAAIASCEDGSLHALIAAASAPGVVLSAPLSGAEHAALELRRVGIGLLVELERLGAGLSEAVRTQLGDCRAQLPALGARVPEADDGPLLPAADELALVLAELDRHRSATMRAGRMTPIAALVRTAEEVEGVPGVSRKVNFMLFDTEEAMAKPIGGSAEAVRPALQLGGR